MANLAANIAVSHNIYAAASLIYNYFLYYVHYRFIHHKYTKINKISI